MKHTLLSLTAILALNEGLFASDEAENFNEMFTKSRIGGEFRAIYQSNSKLNRLDGTNGSSHTGVIGGKVEFATRTYKGFDAVVTGYGTMSAGGNRNQTDGDYLNNGKGNSNYALLGQAFIRYTNGESFIQAGRFELDTPLMNSDDIRMVPNLFEGVYASLSPLENITLQAGYINRMAGWENGGDNASFEKIGVLIDGMSALDTYAVGKSSVSFAGISYGNEESPFSVRLYDYMTKEVMNQIYADMGINVGMLNIQGQYLRSIADDRLKNYIHDNAIADTMIDSTVWGASAAVTLEEAHLGFSFAYNESKKKTNTLNGGGTADFFGGANDPFFTSMDVLTAHTLGGVKAYKGEVTFDPSESLSFVLAHALFKKEDGFKNKESDLCIGYTLQENIYLEGMVSKVIETDDLGNESTDNRARLALRVGF
ncbi:MAG TPA: OprD family outer membrane porin [Sulfuricurvum sp.]|nr:OprD family outer membrane porin [Sulfuricurvum sp.]